MHYYKICHGVKQQKYVPLVKQDVMKFAVKDLDKELIRRERRDGGEGEERGLRKGEREMIEIERKETKQQFEDKEGLRDPPFIEFSRSDLAI